MREQTRISVPMWVGLLTTVAVAACEEHFERPATIVVPDAEVTDVAFFRGDGIGATCDDDLDCRSGLECKSGECEANGDKAEDDRCLITAECKDGLQCGWAGFCTEAGEGGQDAECSSSSECARGFYCNLLGGLGGQCFAIDDDAKDLGESCDETGECMSGLVCSPQRKTCSPGNVLLNPDVFRGVACPVEDEPEMEFGVRMHIPDGEALPGFYAFPFPTDIRMKDGKVNLDGHPVPGGALIGSDPVHTVIEAINDEVEGWSVHPGIFFRFSHEVDVESLRTEGDRATVMLIDLDRGERHPITLQFVPERNKYICHNHLYVHPLWSRPLRPDTTYAAIVTTDVKRAIEAEDIFAEPLDDLEMLLGRSEPSGGADKRAWKTFEKLRGHIGDSDALDNGDIAGATVFTTGNPWSPMEAVRAVVRADRAPSITGDPVLCEAGTRSPCATPDYEPPEGTDLRDSRDCPAETSSKYHEIHALLRVPVFQEGDRPYTEGGGALEFAGGKPVVVGHEDVCMGITVPKSPMPDTGWPVIIYGHGTGGSFRSGISTFSSVVSDLDVGNDERRGVVQIAIDQPMHGPRQGDEQGLDPGPLFFNVRNPQAAQGNIFQGASDNFSLVRWIEGFTGELPGAGELRFDAGHIYYHGHSQGGTTGPIFAPYEPSLRAVVFSGCAGSLVFGLLGKSKPYDSSVGLRLALQELKIDEPHPLLHLFQLYFDPSDPLIYAHLLYREPATTPKHAMQVMGQNDSYTPFTGQSAYAGNAGATLGLPDSVPEWFDRIEQYEMATSEFPISGNIEVDGQAITGVVTQYLNDPGHSVGGEPYDGHFVTYQNLTAIDQVRGFFASLLVDDVPTVQ